MAAGPEGAVPCDSKGAEMNDTKPPESGAALPEEGDLKSKAVEVRPTERRHAERRTLWWILKSITGYDAEKDDIPHDIVDRAYRAGQQPEGLRTTPPVNIPAILVHAATPAYYYAEAAVTELTSARKPLTYV